FITLFSTHIFTHAVLFSSAGYHRALHSFPTRRSSDLEHLLEHLTLDEGRAFLSDCRRLLMPGRIMRVAMPSLDVLCKKYSSDDRSEEHTSELQSRGHLVCRLLLEKKNGTVTARATRYR